jgi:hypothetical protein
MIASVQEWAQWLSGLRHGSVAVRLLGLRFRIPPGAWMFVLCVLYSKDIQDKGKNTDKVQRENKRIKKIPPGALMSVVIAVCVVR